MKNFYLLLFLLLATNSVVFGQIFKDFKTMEHVYKDWINRGACDTLYYTEKVSPLALDATIKLISSSKTFPLYDLYIGTETKPLTITSSEQSYLIEALRKLKTFNWPAGLFPKSKRISQNGINSVFTVTNQFSEEKFHSCSLIYSFSKPIFFRNGTICLYIDQEIYSSSNTRLFTQFFSKIKGHWEEYADVYLHLEDEGSPTKHSTDAMISQVIQSQKAIKTSPQPGFKPEKLFDFGKRVFSTFQSQNNDSFSILFPTLEQRTTIAKSIGIPTRNRSSEFLRGNQAMAILKFDYECAKVLDTAKIFKINWANAIYSDVKKSEIILPVKDNKGNQITFTNLNVEFTESDRKFQIKLQGIYLIDNTWKTTSILGLSEIKKE